MRRASPTVDIKSLKGLGKFGFRLESDNLESEAVECDANTIIRIKRPEVKGSPAYSFFKKLAFLQQRYR